MQISRESRFIDKQLTFAAGARLQLRRALAAGLMVMAGTTLTAADGTAVLRPVNDDYVNRTILEGRSVRFAGPLTGATIEAGEPGPEGGASVWWTWTAPESGHVVIEVLWGCGSSLSVFTGGEIASLERVTDTPACWKRYATFRAEAGVTYQIRSAGESDPEGPGSKYALRMESLPVLLEQPATQTIFPGEWALFTVAVAESPDATHSIQWQFNGADLAGETLPALAISNAAETQSGEYRALVTAHFSDGTLMTKTSVVARLNVTEAVTTPRITLEPDPSNDSRLLLNVIGDEGRTYRLSHGASIDQGTSFISHPSAFPLSLETMQDSHFWSAGSVSSLSICVMNMEQIHFAQERLAADGMRASGAPFTLDELKRYIRVENLACPDGADYNEVNLGRLDSEPSCIHPGYLPRERWHAEPEL